LTKGVVNKKGAFMDKMDDILDDLLGSAVENNHDAKNSVELEKELKKKPRYKSQEGFVEVPLLRGFTEIQEIYHFANMRGGMICGGYARYCASPRLINISPAGDVDIYCPNLEVFETLEKDLKEYLSVRWTNDISITYNRSTEDKFAYSPTIQLIKPVLEGRVVATGSPEEILQNFDFTIVRAFIKDPKTVLVDADFLHDESSKILRLKNIHCPISSTLRCMKYSVKGYWLPPTQALKLFVDWMERDDEYRMKIVNFLETTNDGEGLSQEEVNEMEKLMRID
jgi:hypothetical protein